MTETEQKDINNFQQTAINTQQEPHFDNLRTFIRNIIYYQRFTSINPSG
jgi:hypothetical protein